MFWIHFLCKPRCTPAKACARGKVFSTLFFEHPRFFGRGGADRFPAGKIAAIEQRIHSLGTEHDIVKLDLACFAATEINVAAARAGVFAVSYLAAIKFDGNVITGKCRFDSVPLTRRRTAGPISRPSARKFL